MAKPNDYTLWTAIDAYASFEVLDGERDPWTWDEGFHFQHDLRSFSRRPINRFVILPIREWMIKHMVGNTQIIIPQSTVALLPTAFRFQRIEDATFFKLRWGQDVISSRDI